MTWGRPAENPGAEYGRQFGGTLDINLVAAKDETKIEGAKVIIITMRERERRRGKFNCSQKDNDNDDDGGGGGG